MSKREGNNRDEAMLLKYVHAGIPDVVHVVCVQINGRRADKLRGREKGFLKCRLVVFGVSHCVWRKEKKRNDYASGKAKKKEEKNLTRKSAS